jgi:hypothetical protein
MKVQFEAMGVHHHPAYKAKRLKATPKTPVKNIMNQVIPCFSSPTRPRTQTRPAYPICPGFRYRSHLIDVLKTMLFTAPSLMTDEIAGTKRIFLDY